MSNKRLSRKRLFTMEKEGKDVDVGASTLMKGCISSATQHRQGYQVITDIVVDLASSKQTLISGGDASIVDDVIGAGTSPAYVAKLDNSVFGHITKVETICLEKFVGSAGVLTGTNSIRLLSGGDDGELNEPPTGKDTISDDIGDEAGRHNLKEYNNNSLDGQYVYFVLGSAAATAVDKATATITVPVGVTETDIASGITRIILCSDGATPYVYTFDGGAAWDYGYQAGKINIQGVDDELKLAAAIKDAIDGTTGFTAVDNADGTVTVTFGTEGVAGNKKNAFQNAPGADVGITVPNFTGGTTKGDASPVTAGKFLLRFTGFVEPEDI